MKKIISLTLILMLALSLLTVPAMAEDSRPARVVGLHSKPNMTETELDSGVSYDPLQKPDPDITLSAEEREIGGLGIYTAKKATDKMEYRRENDQNILTIYKQI